MTKIAEELPIIPPLHEWLRQKAARTEDVGDSTDFSHAADVLEALTEAGQALLDQINEEGPLAKHWQAIGARMDALDAALNLTRDGER